VWNISGPNLAEPTADQESWTIAQSTADQSACESPGPDTCAQLHHHQPSVFPRYQVDVSTINYQVGASTITYQVVVSTINYQVGASTITYQVVVSTINYQLDVSTITYLVGASAITYQVDVSSIK